MKINLFFLTDLLFYFCNSILIYFTILNNISTIYMVDIELFLLLWVSQNLKSVLHTTNVITVRNLKRFNRVLKGSRFFPLGSLLAGEKRIQHCRSILLDTYSVGYTLAWRRSRLGALVYTICSKDIFFDYGGRFLAFYIFRYLTNSPVLLSLALFFFSYRFSTFLNNDRPF